MTTRKKAPKADVGTPLHTVIGGEPAEAEAERPKELLVTVKVDEEATAELNAVLDSVDSVPGAQARVLEAMDLASGASVADFKAAVRAALKGD